MFDAETYATLSTLRIFDQRQKNRRRYTIFADPTAAINQVRADAVDPDQRLARAAIEVCSSIESRDNDVTALWVPAHVRTGKGWGWELLRAPAVGWPSVVWDRGRSCTKARRCHGLSGPM